MAIRNPHGVGDSGPLVREYKACCQCCGLFHVFKAHPRMPERWPKRCGPCAEHRLDGTDQEQIDTLAEHATRARQFGERAYQVAAETHREADRVDQRNRHLSHDLHEVITERNTLRRTVDALKDLHPYGRSKCACGRRPCPERDVLYGHDPAVQMGA